MANLFVKTDKKSTDNVGLSEQETPLSHQLKNCCTGRWGTALETHSKPLLPNSRWPQRWLPGLSVYITWTISVHTYRPSSSTLPSMYNLQEMERQGRSIQQNICFVERRKDWEGTCCTVCTKKVNGWCERDEEKGRWVGRNGSRGRMTERTSREVTKPSLLQPFMLRLSYTSYFWM